MHIGSFVATPVIENGVHKECSRPRRTILDEAILDSPH